MSLKNTAGVLWLACLVTLGARAQTAQFAFSGGNGTAPLTVQFVTPLQLTTTQATSGVMLVLHGIYSGSAGDGAISPTSPLNWSYTVNGAADAYQDQGAHPLYDWNFAAGSLSASDFLIKISQDTNNTNAIASGSTYSFPAGFSFTTGTSNWTSNPADYHATFDVYLNNSFGGRISAIQAGAVGAATPVPEPATTALVGGGIALVTAGWIGRRRRVSANRPV